MRRVPHVLVLLGFILLEVIWENSERTEYWTDYRRPLFIGFLLSCGYMGNFQTVTLVAHSLTRFCEFYVFAFLVYVSFNASENAAEMHGRIRIVSVFDLVGDVTHE